MQFGRVLSRYCLLQNDVFSFTFQVSFLGCVGTFHIFQVSTHTECTLEAVDSHHRSVFGSYASSGAGSMARLCRTLWPAFVEMQNKVGVHFVAVELDFLFGEAAAHP